MRANASLQRAITTSSVSKFPARSRASLSETYGLELKDVLVSEDKVLNSYRRDVSKLIPKPLESPGTSKGRDQETFGRDEEKVSVQSV